jgi:wyosine [tRNA(Phe)-imidazoG37] synthetase (radical SAM superfamily)
MKPYYITVSGGEPLLLSDIFYLSEKLKNVCQKLLLTTNGTLVRRRNMPDGWLITILVKRVWFFLFAGKTTRKCRLFLSGAAV